MNKMYDDSWFLWSGNDAKASVVIEKDEIQITKLLGPDGQPYAIRRPKAKLGFDLTPTKS
jgi:hypothetical protein